MVWVDLLCHTPVRNSFEDGCSLFEPQLLFWVLPWMARCHLLDYKATKCLHFDMKQSHHRVNTEPHAYSECKLLTLVLMLPPCTLYLSKVTLRKLHVALSKN